MGTTLANLAHLMELSVTQNMTTASCFARAQGTASAHLVGERGSLVLIKDEIVKISRDRLLESIADPRLLHSPARTLPWINSRNVRAARGEG